MKPLALRLQLFVVMVLVEATTAGVGFSYWVQSRAHASLEEAFQHDLLALVRLPRLHERLQRLDESTNKYLITGNRADLRDRAVALQEVNGSLREITSLAEGLDERELVARMDRGLSGHLAQQGQWVGRRQAGRLSTAEAERLIHGGDAFDAIAAEYLRSRDSHLRQLQRRRLDVLSATRQTLGFILGMGAAAGIVIVFFLSHFLVGPLRALRAYAASWTLGQAWDMPEPRSSPELSELFHTLSELTARLNVQYGKEEELARLKTQLVSLVSHEFNNALTVINGMSFLLKEGEGGGSSPERAEYYAVVDSTIRALKMASSNILNMGRLESGKFAVQTHPMEPAALVSETVQRMRFLSDRKRVTVSVELPKSPALALGDPEALSLVITNLLGNAVKYTPEGGRVTVAVEPAAGPPRGVRIRVADTGIGISRQDQERIFSGFYRTEAGKKEAKGFGLGLALAHSVIEAHGASLGVDSEPGRGSTFSFILPAA